MWNRKSKLFNFEYILEMSMMNMDNAGKSFHISESKKRSFVPCLLTSQSPFVCGNDSGTNKCPLLSTKYNWSVVTFLFGRKDAIYSWTYSKRRLNQLHGRNITKNGTVFAFFQHQSFWQRKHHFWLTLPFPILLLIQILQQLINNYYYIEISICLSRLYK